MKNFVSRQEFPIVVTLIFYILAGVIALALFSPDSSNPPQQTSSAQSSTLYDIRPELSAPPRQVPEETEEPDTEEAKEAEEVHYYAFTTMNRFTRLHVREEPSADGKIISHLRPGSTGYVVELGESWSLIQTPDTTGYVFNKYMDFQEVSEEEYMVW